MNDQKIQRTIFKTIKVNKIYENSIGFFTEKIAGINA